MPKKLHNARCVETEPVVSLFITLIIHGRLHNVGMSPDDHVFVQTDERTALWLCSAQDQQRCGYSLWSHGRQLRHGSPVAPGGHPRRRPPATAPPRIAPPHLSRGGTMCGTLDHMELLRTKLLFIRSQNTLYLISFYPHEHTVTPRYLSPSMTDSVTSHSRVPQGKQGATLC